MSKNSGETARCCIGMENLQLEEKSLDEGKVDEKSLDEAKVDVKSLDEVKVDVKSLDEVKVDVKSLDKALDEAKFDLEDLQRTLESVSGPYTDIITDHNLLTLVCTLERTFIKKCYYTKKHFSRNVGSVAKAKGHSHPTLDTNAGPSISLIQKSLKELISNVEKFHDGSQKLMYISEVSGNLHLSASVHLRWPKALRKNVFDIKSYTECLLVRTIMYKHSYERICKDFNAVWSDDIRSFEDFTEKILSLPFFFKEFRILISIMEERHTKILKLLQDIRSLTEDKGLSIEQEHCDLNRRKEERELVTNQQDSCSQDGNPGDTSHTLDSTEAGSLIEPMQNLGTKEFDNSDESSEASSSSEEFSLEKYVSRLRTVNKLTEVILVEFSSMKGLIENLPLKKVNLMKSDKEFVLKFTECERVHSLNSLIRKVIIRCSTLEKSYLADFLKSIKSDSSMMDSKKINIITNCMRLNFVSRKYINSLLPLTYKNEKYLNTYSAKLE
ncbi:hypothetical protein TNCT_40681 [Trichonephila clavata]|uniref:Uncharacterized protein n=1 Tax=Trichonephila clavata TaxID=2740835 RepID=A0A8X6FIX5_TRICU|nr:hypothetical protein TNCT_40681 [Trichonephila clavata]